MTCAMTGLARVGITEGLEGLSGKSLFPEYLPMSQPQFLWAPGGEASYSKLLLQRKDSPSSHPTTNQQMASHKGLIREWNSGITNFFLSFVLFGGAGMETKTSPGKIRLGQELYRTGSRRAQGEVVTEGKITTRVPQIVGCHTFI